MGLERRRLGALELSVRGLLAALIALLGLSSGPAGARASIEEHLSQASVALSQGDLDQAIASLEEVRSGILADHVALLRARALRENGNLDAAVDAVREGLERNAPSEVRAALHREEGRARLAAGDLLAAYRAQRAGWEATRSTERAAEIAIEVARAFDEALLPGDALIVYRLIWSKWPLTRLAEEAYVRSAKLEKATGADPASPRELLRFAGPLRTSGRCDLGLDIYDRVLAFDGLDEHLLRRARHGRADCLFAVRRYAEAAAAYDALLAEKPDDVRAAVNRARSHARNGERTKALKEFDAISKRAERSTRVRVGYLAAILSGSPEHDDAWRRLREIEKQRTSPGYARLARWRLAWNDVEAGRWAEAAKRLGVMARGDLFDVEVQRAQYWLAIADLEQGREERGIQRLRGMLEKIPLSYYGFLAADRLREVPALHESFLPPRSEPAEDPAVERASRLLRANLKESASLELESRVRSDKLHREQRLQLARLLHEVENHFRAVRLLVDGFGASLEQGIDPVWEEAWHLAWPRPYAPEVGRAALEFGADPSLVYAVMREESTYRPEALSPVGARGLMQIMPPTGERIAGSLGVDGFEPDHLYRPETSIRFGSAYLRDLLRSFKGQRPLAIAAYNAGPEVVSSWAREHRPFVVDRFVDSVPYSETRRYLRRVIRSYRVYRLLYGAEVATPDVSSHLNPWLRPDDSSGSE